MMALGLLAKIPAIAWALAAVLAWGGWQRWQVVSQAADLKEARTHVEAANAAVQSAQETTRRATALQEIVNVQAEKLEKARADAAAASAAGQRLRSRLAAVQRDASSDSTAAAVRSATGTAAAVLADLLGRCSDRREELARYADAAREAGGACERAYDALTPPS